MNRSAFKLVFGNRTLSAGFFLLLCLSPLRSQELMPVPVVAGALLDLYPGLAGQLQVLEKQEKLDAREQLERLAAYMSPADSDWRLGLALVLADTSSPVVTPVLDGLAPFRHDNTRANYSLFILLRLLEDHPEWQYDSILLAMAIANNDLFAIADTVTRRTILEDIAWHLDFYNRVLASQKRLPLLPDLRRAPVAAKVFWADRNQYMDSPPGGRLTLEQYREFVSTPAALQQAFDYFGGLSLPAVDSLRELAVWMEFQIRKRNVRLDHLAAGNRNYRLETVLSDEERNSMIAAIQHYERFFEHEHYGIKRSWAENYWLNRQLDLFSGQQGWLGDCVSTSLVMRSFYASLGIPAVNFRLQAIPEGDRTYSHNFPVYYDGYTGRFECLQLPAFWLEEHALYFTKPVWNHLLRSSMFYSRENNRAYNPFYPGEVADTRTVGWLLQTGLATDHVYRLLFSAVTHQRGLFFDAPRIVQARQARDGTDVPASAKQVLAGRAAVSADDPAGDCQGTGDRWDILKVSIHTDSRYYLLAIDFHGQVRDNLLLVQSLNVYNTDTGETWFLQWDQVPHEGRLYKRVDGQLRTVVVPFTDLSLWRQGDRLILRLAKTHFGSGRSFKFRFYSSALKEDRSYIIAADSSDWITVNIR